MIRSVLFGLALAVTAPVAAPLAAQNAEHDPMVDFSADDREMNAAKAKGRETLPQFFAALAKPGKGESGFMLKFDLSPEGKAEFIWADTIAVEGGVVRGTLANAPLAEGHKLGERLVIDRALIVDWGYWKNGVMQGNYTTRVVLKKLPQGEAAAIRKSFGW